MIRVKEVDLIPPSSSQKGTPIFAHLFDNMGFGQGDRQYKKHAIDIMIKNGNYCPPSHHHKSQGCNPWELNVGGLRAL